MISCPYGNNVNFSHTSRIHFSANNTSFRRWMIPLPRTALSAHRRLAAVNPFCMIQVLHFCTLLRNPYFDLEPDCIIRKPIKWCFQQYLVHTEIMSTFHAWVKYISQQTIHHSAHSKEWNWVLTHRHTEVKTDIICRYNKTSKKKSSAHHNFRGWGFSRPPCTLSKQMFCGTIRSFRWARHPRVSRKFDYWSAIVSSPIRVHGVACLDTYCKFWSVMHEHCQSDASSFLICAPNWIQFMGCFTFKYITLQFVFCISALLVLKAKFLTW